MNLIADYTKESPEAQRTTIDKLLGVICADAKFNDERDDMRAYIQTLSTGVPLDEQTIRDGYEAFKQEKNKRTALAIAKQHGLDPKGLEQLIATTMKLLRFDGEQLRDLVEPLELGWKARAQKELAIMEELAPHLRHLAGEKEIAGLKEYED